MEDEIYKVTTRKEWELAEREGLFRGAAVDLKDGFIHFSTRYQVRETVEKHFAGQADLLLIEMTVDRLGHALKWEVSRGGDLFPHLYGTFVPGQVNEVMELPLGPDGRHLWPPGLAL